MSYRTGQLIGPYQIQKYLNGGGMGDVYLAWDSAQEWPVALKLLKPEAMRDPRLVERFRREAVITSQLRHPHLVQVYDVGQTPEGRHYMAMAYIDGGTLEDRLQQYRGRNQLMPINEALYLARRIAEAMAYAHQHGVVHRDLKPGNILLRRTGEPVVTDLGIAAIAGASSLTRTLDSLGTPHYMAPEQVRQGEVDARVDIYAIGVLLYEMLTGRRPFEAENAWAILNMKLNQMPTKVTAYRADIPAEVAQIIHTCLQTNAAARYPSAQMLAQALDAYAYGVGLPQTTRTATPRPNRPTPAAATPPGRQKAYLPSLYALLGILAVGLFIIFALSSRPAVTFPLPSAPADVQSSEVVAVTTQQTEENGEPVPPTSTRRSDSEQIITSSTPTSTPPGDAAATATATPRKAVATQPSLTSSSLMPRVTLIIPTIPSATPTQRKPGVITVLSPDCPGPHYYTANDSVPFEWRWAGTLLAGEIWELRIGEPAYPEYAIRIPVGQDFQQEEEQWRFAPPASSFHDGGDVDYRWEVALMQGGNPLAVSDQGCFHVKSNSGPGDRDGDGVPDDQDQCPDTPAGSNPDPERLGCPGT